MNDKCNICAKIHNLTANVLTTEFWHVILSPDQGYLGRCYVTLRDHKATLAELSNEEWLDHVAIVRRLENACKLGLNATLSNWSCLMNNAYQEAERVPHVHWHFRPRYDHAVTINGLTFDDPDFGFHYDREHRQVVDEVTFQVIVDRIEEHL